MKLLSILKIERAKLTIGEELEEMAVKPTMSEKKMVTLSKLSATTCGERNIGDAQ
jgi:hypothetical protein